MGKKQHLDSLSRSLTSSGSHRVPLLNNNQAKRSTSEDQSTNGLVTDLEHGDAVQAANVGYFRILSLPKYGGTVIDIVSREITSPEQQAEALEAVKNTILEIVLIVVVGSLRTALRAWLFSATSERVVARLRKNLFSHLIRQEIAFYDVTRTGELLSRLSEDTQIIKNAVTTNLSAALRNITTAFIGIGFMFSSSWRLTLFALVVVPVVSVAVKKFGRYLRELSHKTQAAAAVAASIAEWMWNSASARDTQGEKPFGSFDSRRKFALVEILSQTNPILFPFSYKFYAN